MYCLESDGYVEPLGWVYKYRNTCNVAFQIEAACPGEKRVGWPAISPRPTARHSLSVTANSRSSEGMGDGDKPGRVRCFYERVGFMVIRERELRAGALLHDGLARGYDGGSSPIPDNRSTAGPRAGSCSSRVTSGFLAVIFSADVIENFIVSEFLTLLWFIKTIAYKNGAIVVFPILA